MFRLRAPAGVPGQRGAGAGPDLDITLLSGGCIDLIEQGCDRLGQIDATGSLGHEAGEWTSAKLAAAGGKTAQIDHGPRDAGAAHGAYRCPSRSLFCAMGLGVQYPLPLPADGEVPDWDWLLVTGLPDVLRTYQVPPKLVMPSPFTAPGPESPEKVYSGQPW